MLNREIIQVASNLCILYSLTDSLYKHVALVSPYYFVYDYSANVYLYLHFDCSKESFGFYNLTTDECINRSAYIYKKMMWYNCQWSSAVKCLNRKFIDNTAWIMVIFKPDLVVKLMPGFIPNHVFRKKNIKQKGMLHILPF